MPPNLPIHPAVTPMEDAFLAKVEIFFQAQLDACTEAFKQEMCSRFARLPRVDKQNCETTCKTAELRRDRRLSITYDVTITLQAYSLSVATEIQSKAQDVMR